MTTFDDLIREVRSTLRGYGLVRDAIAFTSASVTSSALSITVDDATGLRAGVVEIGDECIYVRSIAGNVLTVAPDGRGWDGTTAAAHASGVRVVGNPPYPTWRVKEAINNALGALFPDIYGVGTVSFTFNPSITTYEVPAEAEDILKVTTTVYGPSREQVAINTYGFNSDAPTAEFPSGNCLTLGEAPPAGRTVTVTYSKQPTPLSAGSDLLTGTGLRDTARPAVVYTALADLVARTDLSRIDARSATGAALADVVKIGSATQLAAQLTARAEMETTRERDRLRKAHPPRSRWSI